MIANICAESKHRKKIARSDTPLKYLKIHEKVAIFISQKGALFHFFSNFFDSKGSKKFSIDHIHVR